MDLISTTIIAIGLSMDAFAVALGVGTMSAQVDKRSRLRLAFHFGLFQGLMTLLGWLAGSTISVWIKSYDHWVALILLALVGINMIRSGINPETESYKKNPTKGGMMVMLSVATSIDALAVGLSLALVKTPIVQAALMIGIITFSFSIIGLYIGNKLGSKFGKRMEIFGGIVLLGIGIRILFDHML